MVVECLLVKFVEQFIEYGSSVNVVDLEGCIFLIRVIRFFCRFEFIVKFLIENNVDVLVKDKFGCIVLYYFVGFKGNCKIFQILIQKGIQVYDVDNDGNIVLYLVVNNCNIYIVELLI